MNSNDSQLSASDMTAFLSAIINQPKPSTTTVNPSPEVKEKSKE